ncbi:hypothetical protein T440DRAFT_508269 [Plenodomus tracheiphilus IPT5]|uniref:Uncharacterized protein n=1 Tax=Plenodomus tracheiphilus IPT5 TaxID=1408161 RepID=A0A6A7B603_9PLEO|nr:hypothetical protein T440DRAFT_508269 [Plenodomus tracheiphilus IPT5]
MANSFYHTSYGGDDDDHDRGSSDTNTSRQDQEFPEVMSINIPDGQHFFELDGSMFSSHEVSPDSTHPRDDPEHSWRYDGDYVWTGEAMVHAPRLTELMRGLELFERADTGRSASRASSGPRAPAGHDAGASSSSLAMTPSPRLAGSSVRSTTTSQPDKTPAPSVAGPGISSTVTGLGHPRPVTGDPTYQSEYDQAFWDCAPIVPKDWHWKTDLQATQFPYTSSSSTATAEYQPDTSTTSIITSPSSSPSPPINPPSPHLLPFIPSTPAPSPPPTTITPPSSPPTLQPLTDIQLLLLHKWRIVKKKGLEEYIKYFPGQTRESLVAQWKALRERARELARVEKEMEKGESMEGVERT